MSSASSSSIVGDEAAELNNAKLLNSKLIKEAHTLDVQLARCSWENLNMSRQAESSQSHQPFASRFHSVLVSRSMMWQNLQLSTKRQLKELLGVNSKRTDARLMPRLVGAASDGVVDAVDGKVLIAMLLLK